MKKIQNTTKKSIVLLVLTLLFAHLYVPVSAQETKQVLPEEKQTTLELYVTSAEAYEMWKEDPENVHILDVRTLEEYYYVGHASMSTNIPVFLETYQWDSIKGDLAMQLNPEFLTKVKATYQPNNIILITCRSGGRSAFAVNQLAKAGFTNAYNITDGFEGDKVKDPNSVFNGYRMVNGWKNSGLPYTFKVDPKLMLIPDSK